jgi:hypothetical protein
VRSALNLFATIVGFEDQFGGGDRDFNDMTFTMSNVRGPVPDGGSTTAMLLGIGLGVIEFIRRKLRLRA